MRYTTTTETEMNQKRRPVQATLKRAPTYRKAGMMTKGARYEVQNLEVFGWTIGDGTGQQGYQLQDYFSDSGEYLGEDCNGIEPKCYMKLC